MFIQNQEQHYSHGEGRSIKQCRTFEVNPRPSYHFGEVCIALTFQELHFQN